jgi:hypothetical protein
LAFTKKCTYSLVPGYSWFKHFNRTGYLDNAIFFPVDPVIQSIPKSNIAFQNEPYLVYPAFDLSFSARKSVQQIAEIVKQCCPHVKYSIIDYKPTLPTVEGCDNNVYDWRLLKYVRQADWIIDLNPQPLLCLFPTLAGGLGLQWSGYNVPPNNDHINKARFHAIETKTKQISKNVFRAIMDVEDTAKQLVQQITTPFVGHADRNAFSGTYDQRHTTFLKAVGTILKSKIKF